MSSPIRGLSLRRSTAALVVLAILAIGLFAWGTSTGIPDDLHEAARATALHLLAHAEEILQGDDGFARLLHEAFTRQVK